MFDDENCRFALVNAEIQILAVFFESFDCAIEFHVTFADADEVVGECIGYGCGVKGSKHVVDVQSEGDR